MTAHQLSTLIVLILSLFFPPKTSPKIPSFPTPSIVRSETQAKVIKIVDGDTLKVNIDTTIETIRLIGLDTPEVVDPRKPVQCFGREASAKMKELATNQTVKLVSDPTQGDRDKYGRLLRYIYLENGTLLNQKMIAEGYGHEYTYDIPYQYQTDFKLAEETAMDQRLGLWDDNVCKWPIRVHQTFP